MINRTARNETRRDERRRVEFVAPKKARGAVSLARRCAFACNRSVTKPHNNRLLEKPIFTFDCERLSSRRRRVVQIGGPRWCCLSLSLGVSLICMMREPTKATGYFQSLPLTRSSSLPPIVCISCVHVYLYTCVHRSMTNAPQVAQPPRETRENQ